jgi:hypothetical protein
VATASGEPRYSWTSPTGVFGSGGPLVAVGVLPHANEPLGTAFTSTVPAFRGPGRLALIGPIDLPPASHRFGFSIDPVGYVAGGYLQPLPDQVEFAHRPRPLRAAQHRAAQVLSRLAELRPDAFLLLHNDVGAVDPYLYANRTWPAVTRRVRALRSCPLPPAGWTSLLDECTYAYFPASRVGVPDSECAGRYIEETLGIPTLTVELPMFAWDADDPARLAVAEAMGEWIAQGAGPGGDRDRLVRQVSTAVGDRHVSMVPAAVSARTVWAAVNGVFEDRSAGLAGEVALQGGGEPVDQRGAVHGGHRG